MLYIHQLLALFQSAVCRKVKSQFWVTHKTYKRLLFSTYYLLFPKMQKKQKRNGTEIGPGNAAFVSQTVRRVGGSYWGKLKCLFASHLPLRLPMLTAENINEAMISGQQHSVN